MATLPMKRNSNKTLVVVVGILVIGLAIALIASITPSATYVQQQQARFISSVKQVTTTSEGNTVTICPDGSMVYIKAGDVPCDEQTDGLLTRIARTLMQQWDQEGTVGKFLEEIYQLRMHP